MYALYECLYSTDNAILLLVDKLKDIAELCNAYIDGGRVKPKSNIGLKIDTYIKSDEIYCRNEYRNGRTCSEIAFEVKSQKDPFYNTYRIAYKTMSARAARMVGKQAGKANLEEWRNRAKLKLEECRAENDIEGFKLWVSESKK